MQKTTLVLVLIALGLGGYVYFFETRSPSPEETVTASQETPFSFAEKEVQRLEIQKENEPTLEFIRLETTASNWRMKRPEGSPAADAAIVFLLDLFVKTTAPKTFTVESNELAPYGFNQPLATITIELNNNTRYQITLGNPTFDNEQIYAQINPEEDTPTQQVYILPIDFQYAVDRSLSEWKQSPSQPEPPETQLPPPNE